MKSRFTAMLLVAGYVGLSPAPPASAVEFAQTGKSFQDLMADGYRLVAASPTPGLVIPMLMLAKDGSPEIFMCFQQFRDCVRLVDSPNNTPVGVPAPEVPQVPSR